MFGAAAPWHQPIVGIVIKRRAGMYGCGHFGRQATIDIGPAPRTTAQHHRTPRLAVRQAFDRAQLHPLGPVHRGQLGMKARTGAHPVRPDLLPHAAGGTDKQFGRVRRIAHVGSPVPASAGKGTHRPARQDPSPEHPARFTLSSRWQVSRLADVRETPCRQPRLPGISPVAIGQPLRSRSRGRLRLGTIRPLSHSLFTRTKVRAPTARICAARPPLVKRRDHAPTRRHGLAHSRTTP